MQPASIPLSIVQGATLRESLRVMQSQFEYRPIEAISATAPVLLTVDHGLPKDWPVWVQGVQGLQELNRSSNQAPLLATVVDDEHLEINAVSAAGRSAAGGMLVYHPPVDLTGAAAVLRVLDEKGATLLVFAPTVNAAGWIDIDLSAEDTAGLEWSKGTWQLDVTMSNGDVVRLFTGPATVTALGSVPATCGAWPSWVYTFGTQGLPGAGGEGGGGGGGLLSFNGRTAPAVVLIGSDVTGALGYSPVNPAALAGVALTGSYIGLTDKPFIPATYGDVGAASAAQGALAETAVQQAQLSADLNLKVDKVTGYGLSKNDLTDARAAKLDAMEASHFKGSHTTDEALTAAHPTAVAGDYAWVDVPGQPARQWLWDPTDNEWVAGSSAGTMTPSQVLELYESNPDRNAFTDALKAKLTDIQSGATKNSNTDELQESATPTNKWFTNARALGALLTGLSLSTTGDLAATDSVLVAFGKLQRKWNDLATLLSSMTTAIGQKLTNPMTTLGDLIIGGASGAATRLAVGAEGKVVKVVNGRPAYADPTRWDKYKCTQSFRPSSGGAVGTQVGYSVSTGGTTTHPTQDTSNLQGAIRRARWTSTAATGATAGIYEAALTKVRGDSPGIGGFLVEMTFTMSTNVTGHQCFVGMIAAGALLGADPSLGANMIGMGYDAADLSTGNWQLMRNDASGTATRIDLPLAPRNTTDVYFLSLQADANGSGITVKIVNLSAGALVLSDTYTTDIPAASVFLGMRANARTGATTVACAVDLSNIDAGYQE